MGEKLQEAHGEFPFWGGRGIKCQYCVQPFRTADNLNQHLVRCEGNPHKKKPFPCDICKKGKFYLSKELRAHKKHNHWK